MCSPSSPLPFDEPARLVFVSNGEWGRGQALSSLTVQAAYVQALQDQSQSLSDVAGYHLFDRDGDHTLLGDGEPERLTRLRVTGNFFDLLGVGMAHGRSFTEQEVEDEGIRAVILTNEFWRRRFASDPGVVGRALPINGQPATVVGVLPATFDFPDTFAPGSRVHFVEPWPLNERNNRSGNTLALIGRLAPGVGIVAAEEETRAIAERTKADNLNDFMPWLVPLRTRVSGHLRPATNVLAAAVGLVMLVVCANLASLLLARGAARRRELAIRSAIGADGRRLARQTLTESVLLAGTGALGGVLVALAATRVLSSLDLGIPLMGSVRVDSWVLGVALLSAVFTGLLFGALPALRAAQTSPALALGQGGKGSSAGRSAGSARSLLVASEVALTCVLLVGAGLLTRSLVELLNTDLGFRPEQAYAVRVDPDTRFGSYGEQVAYYDDLLGRMTGLPGVEQVGLTDVLPVAFNRRWDGCPAEVDRSNREACTFPYVRVVSEGYLAALGLTLVSGRDLSRDDNTESEAVALISEAFGERIWPGLDPIGRSLRSSGSEYRVVGVTRGMRHLSPDQAPEPELFLSMRQNSDFRRAQLIVRSSLTPADLSAVVRSSLRSFRPTLPVREIVPVSSIVDGATVVRRFIVTVLIGFSLFTLLLASLGLYGVIAHSVTQRSKEMGIRLALGESPVRLRRRVLLETVRLAGLGVGAGVVVALLLAGALDSLLFGISTVDPLTFAAVPALLIGVAAVAGFAPALRASRVDPIQALSADG